MDGPDTLGVSRQQQPPQRSDTDYSIASTTFTPAQANEAPAATSPRQGNDLSYMHRPPTIMPNYGKKSRGSVLPKSSVSRVLLYDNITQQTMLGVRLNSIQSQSYKTNRELEMHMKSFISRRKARQKALKNLTRVQHYDDYLQFQQEQEQQQSRQKRFRVGSFGSESSGEDHGVTGSGPAHLLPQIGFRSSSGHPHPNPLSPTISDVRRQVKSVNEVKETHQSTERVNDDDKSSVEMEVSPSTNNHKPNKSISRSTESLPHIALSAPSSLVRNNKALVGRYHSLDQDKRIGYRLVKGQNGHTRIFHALPDEDNGKYQYENHSLRKPEPGHKSQKLLPLRRGMQNRRPRLKHVKQRELNSHAFMNSSFGHNESALEEDEGINSGELVEEPLSDFRYLHLHKLLIKQEPPNEGYTELSPSYPRRYPTIKDVVMLAKRQERQRRKGANCVEGINGDANDVDDKSVCSEDELCTEWSASDGDEHNVKINNATRINGVS